MILRKNTKKQHYEYGTIIEDIYVNKEDLPHRLDGPAIVRYNKETGKLIEEQYCINGKEYDEFEYWILAAILNN